MYRTREIEVNGRSSLITHHSLLITHHSSIIIRAHHTLNLWRREIPTVRQPTVENHRKTNTENILKARRRHSDNGAAVVTANFIFTKLFRHRIPVKDCSIHIPVQAQVAASLRW
jgi:hypothetical protein